MPYEPTKGSWKPGQCGNPNGRPKGSKNRFKTAEIREAVERWEKKNDQKWAEVCLMEAFKVPSIMKDIMARIYGPVPTDLGEELRENPGRFVMVAGSRPSEEPEEDKPNSKDDTCDANHDS